MAEVENCIDFFQADHDDYEAVDIAQDYLVGDARCWWIGLKKAGKLPITFDEFSQAIQNKYAPRNALAGLQERLSKLQQKTTVMVYTNEFQHILGWLPDYNKTQMLIAYKQGLQLHIHLHINIAKPQTLDDVEEIALFVEDSIIKEKKESPPPKPTKPGNPTRPSPSAPGSPSGPLKLSAEEKEYLRANNGCYQCCKLGHLLNQCPTFSSKTTAAATTTKPDLARKNLRANAVDAATSTSTLGFQTSA